MDNRFTIGEVARLLNIPAATLRFWEEQGLFSVEKDLSRYRRYTIPDLLQIANVVFFRNLGVPVSHVREVEECTLEEYADYMKLTQVHLEQKIQDYYRMCQRTQAQLQHVEAIRQLMRWESLEEEIPFEAVASFDYLEKDKLIQYVQDPSRYVRYFDTQDMSTEVRGIIVSSDYDNCTLLWQKRPGIRFLAFLIREKPEHDYESDVEQTLARIQTRYKTGHLLAQYLLTARENGEQTDYLKGYVEVFPLC